MFISFLNKLKTDNNSTLIEAVKHGYNVLIENNDVITVRGISNLVKLFERVDISLTTKAKTLLAVLQKTHGYYWGGLSEVNSLLKRIPTDLAINILDSDVIIDELHPDRIKYFKNQINKNIQEAGKYQINQIIQEAVNTVPKELTLYHGTNATIDKNIFKTPLWLISDKSRIT